MQLSPYQAQARFYMLPRAFEALRLRGASSDRLARELFPLDPSTSRPYSLAHQILRDKLATLQKLNSSDALPRDLEGTALFIRGQAVDKFIDDELCATLHAMRRALVKNGKGAKIPRLQVVDLGCGLSTRPWALPGLSDVTWYDLDLPDVLAFKRDLLSSAGAQLEAFPAHVDLHNHPQNSTSNETTKQNNASAGNNGSPDNLSRPAHPLLTATYVQIEADLVAQDSSLWVSQLESGGWDPHAPTVWLMVALVYYLSPADAKALMERVASVAGAAGSSQALIGTIMNQSMVDLISASAKQAAANRPPPSSGAANSTAPAQGESTSDRVRSSKVSEDATGVRFGVKEGIESFLSSAGWPSAEEVTVGDIERMYGCVTVGLEYPEDLRKAVVEANGHEPSCGVGVARMGAF